LVSSQGSNTMCPSGLERSTSFSVCSTAHPAAWCCFISIFKTNKPQTIVLKTSEQQKRCWCRNQIAFILCCSSRVCVSACCGYWWCRGQSYSWQHLEKGLLRLLAAGRVVPGRWHGVVVSRVSLLCFDKGGSSFLCCHSQLLAGSNR